MSEPTNRELMHLIGELQVTVEKTLVQSTKTNGRVGELEKWRSFTTGGLSILAMMVVPVLIYLITHWK